MNNSLLKYRISIVVATLFLFHSLSGIGQEQPNIVLIFPDNLGVGEVSAYGSPRGITTPNIDRIGKEGIRLNNFNVEYSCVVSRIAILTGRYAVRAGDGAAGDGMTLYEETMAERLKTAGYATALFGKWHVGGPAWEGKREPTHQGFDEWWGIPGTSTTAQNTMFDGFDPKLYETSYIWEGTKGQPSKKVKPYDIDTRRTIDREAAQKGIAFMKQNVKKKKPFFLYYPMTQVHFPTLTHPDKMGSTGAGDMADAMADVDHNVGLILEEIKKLGIEKNTLVIWCTDNGAEMRRPWRGAAGPWRGYYNSAMEGGIRTPFVAMWPSKIKPGQVSNEMMHEIDIFPTITAAAGLSEPIPKDRAFDGVNQLDFLKGKQPNSNRESAIFLARQGYAMAVKWENWKLWYYYSTEEYDPDPDNLVRLFDLNVDPREEFDMKDFYPWVIPVMDSILADYEASLIKHPRISGKAPDPYIPPILGSGEPVQVYARSDRELSKTRSKALENPNFSGAWSTKEIISTPPRRGMKPEPMPTLGSGWGDEISIVHEPDTLEIERVVFVPREKQSPVRYRFDLNGSTTENRITIGRSWPAPKSTTKWDGDRLVITTMYSFVRPKTKELGNSMVTQTLWLQPASRSPWEPTLVVETTRHAILNGKPSTNRTVYYKGYR